MAQFRDQKYETWTISVHIPLLRRIRAETNGEIDLLQAFGVSLDRLSNPERLAQVLWIVCEQQATRRHLSEDQFAERLTGEVIEQATQALIEAVIDFFPPPQRELYRSLLQTLREQTASVRGQLLQVLSDLPSGSSSPSGAERPASA